MLGNPDWWRSFFFLWGPWLFLVALGGLGAFALAVFIRRALRRRGVALAARWLVAAVLCGLFAFLDVFALSIAVGTKDTSPGTVIVLGMVLLVSLLGLLGCGAYAIWRIVEAKPAA
jgi:protein-S-isoprenylcysteine O-methyltransferase Ste14